MTRLIMSLFVVLVLVCAALALTGVLTFHNSKDETGVTIDKKELKEKTQEAVKKTEETGGKILDKTGEALHKAADGLRSPPDPNTPTTPRLNDKNMQRPDGSQPAPERSDHSSGL
jgi:hypothetical protein